MYFCGKTVPRINHATKNINVAIRVSAASFSSDTRFLKNAQAIAKNTNQTTPTTARKYNDETRSIEVELS